jgi:hypothetical protein
MSFRPARGGSDEAVLKATGMALASSTTRERNMKFAQGYREEAAEVERLARDPRQPPELQAELRAIGRQWRHRAELADWLAHQLGASNASVL